MKGKAQSRPANTKATNNSHVGNSPAVSPAYAHNQNIANRAINKALSAKPRKSR